MIFHRTVSKTLCAVLQKLISLSIFEKFVISRGYMAQNYMGANSGPGDTRIRMPKSKQSILNDLSLILTKNK